MDNNGIMAEAEKLLALLKGSNPSPVNKEKQTNEKMGVSIKRLFIFIMYIRKILDKQY